MKTCYICLQNKKSFKILDCGHKLCLDCYNKIIEIKPSCPFCRSDIKIEVNIKKYNISYKLPKINMDRILRKCDRNRRRNLTIEEYMERRILLKKSFLYNFKDERRAKKEI
jgi:hypothetical protein